MAESSDKKWYVVRAISGKENKVKDLIELEIIENPEKNLLEIIITDAVYYFNKIIN